MTEPINLICFAHAGAFPNMFYPCDTVAGIWNGEMFDNRTPPTWWSLDPVPAVSKSD
jgi:hypothetical protein